MSQDEARLVEDAFEFGEITVRTVMVPRVDMVTVSAEMSLQEAVEQFFRTGLSRLPVVGDSPDDIRGILYVKDVFRLVWQQPEARTLPCHRFARPQSSSLNTRRRVRRYGCCGCDEPRSQSSSTSSGVWQDW